MTAPEYAGNIFGANFQRNSIVSKLQAVEEEIVWSGIFWKFFLEIEIIFMSNISVVVAILLQFHVPSSRLSKHLSLIFFFVIFESSKSL